MKNVGTQILETNRIILRRLKDNDAIQMFNNWCNDEEVTKYLSWFPHGDISVTKELLSRWISSYNKNNFYLWGIELKDNHQLIGTINGFDLKEDSIEIGYCISKQYWHKGYTTEALNSITNFFLDICEFPIVYAKHLEENINSGKVMLKCGYKHIGNEIIKDKYKNDVKIEVYKIEKTQTN